MGILTQLEVVAGVAATASYLLVQYKPDVLLFSKPTFVGTFAQFWTLGFLAWAVWTVILYPKYFSPLRHLPSPPVCILELLLHNPASAH